MCRYVEKSNMEEAINMNKTEHECNSCAFGRPIYDNYTLGEH